MISNYNSTLIVIAIISIFLLSCSTDNIDKSKNDLQLKFLEMADAIKENNLEAFSSHYASTPLHLPPGATLNDSPEKIKNFLAGKLGLYIIDSEPKITYSDDATMAFVYGEYHIEEDSINNIEYVQGRFITIWKMIEGEWKCAVDIWNSPDAKFEHH